jgi:dihydrofolate reductase
MKVILVYVASVDGRTTHWGKNQVYHWSSEEDQKHFLDTIHSHNLLVMGSTTYNNSPKKPSEKILRVVLTRTPDAYKDETIHGQIEFTSNSPKQVINELEKRGYKEMLLVSGEKISTAFFKNNLVDELWLTVEPKIFGMGNHIVAGEKLDISLLLIESKQLNKQATLLLKYKILK